MALLEVANSSGLVFDSAKCTIKQKSISFFGNIYSAEGVSPDPSKVHDIHEMPVPQDKEDLQRFLGLVTYMGCFIRNLSQRASILRDLLKKDVPFEWAEDHQVVFNELKAAITHEASMVYYDVKKPITLEVDASMKGLSAALVQEEKPVAFASKTLTKTQANYSNIEIEMLALVHGVERFHAYLYGRSFTITTDHKPLEMICSKPIASAPPRVQRMLVNIQGYDYSVKCRPGKEMVVSDTLSLLPNPTNTAEVELDMRVDEVSFNLINFSQKNQQTLRDETRKCPMLSALSKVIFQGWPEKMRNLPRGLRSFWSYRDELGIEDGVIFKGKQVLIPESMRPDILRQLHQGHQGHQGIEKTRMLARESVYWQKINEDIEKLTKRCVAYQEQQDQNSKEPMIMTKVPSEAWIFLGTDLFDVKGSTFIILSDYY